MDSAAGQGLSLHATEGGGGSEPVYAAAGRAGRRGASA